MIQPRIIDGVFTDSDGAYTATTQSEPGSFKTEITSQEIIDKLLPCPFGKLLLRGLPPLSRATD